MDEHLVALDAANARIIRAQASGEPITLLLQQRDERSASLKSAYEHLLAANPERQAFLRILIRHLDFVERLRTLDILRTTDSVLETDAERIAFERIGGVIMQRVGIGE